MRFSSDRDDILVWICVPFVNKDNEHIVSVQIASNLYIPLTMYLLRYFVVQAILSIGVSNLFPLAL